MKKQSFAVFDIDGTLIRWQMFHAVVDHLIKNGNMPTESRDSILDSRMQWKKRNQNYSFRDYEKNLIHTFHDYIKDITEESYNQAIEEVFDTYKDQAYCYTRDKIKQLKSEGYLIFAISGSPQKIVDMLGKHYGFDDMIGNHYEFKGGVFTGERQSPIDTGKKVVLEQLISKHDVTIDNSYAFGDSGSDIEMLEEVEYPIAFNPDRNLLNIAKQKRWDIVIERKSLAYTLVADESGEYRLKLDI